MNPNGTPRAEGDEWIKQHGHHRYWMRKVNGKPVYLHRYNYELHYGPIPPRKYIRFVDGDTLNCEPGNLALGYSDQEWQRIYDQRRKTFTT